MEKSGAASGRGNMRSSRPPFLVIALLILTLFLAYNFWSLTSKNGELTRELEALQIDIRSESDKHLAVERQAGELSKQMEEKKAKLAQMESKLGEAEQKLGDSTNEVNSLKDQLQKAQDATNSANQEADKVRQEKDSLAGELENVKKQLTDLQNTPKTCDKQACKEALREVLAAVTEVIGKPPISNALKKHNVDVMSIAGDLLEGGDAGKDQPGAGQEGGQDKQDKRKAGDAAQKVPGKV